MEATQFEVDLTLHIYLNLFRNQLIKKKHIQVNRQYFQYSLNPPSNLNSVKYKCSPSLTSVSY